MIKKSKKMLTVFIAACFLLTSFNPAYAKVPTIDFSAFKAKIKMYIAQLKEVIEVAKIVMSTYQLIKSWGDMFSGGGMIGNVDQLLSNAEQFIGGIETVANNVSEVDSRVGGLLSQYHSSVKSGDLGSAASQLKEAFTPPANATEEELAQHTQATKEYCIELSLYASALADACRATIDPKAEAEEFKTKTEAADTLAKKEALDNDIDASNTAKRSVCDSQVHFADVAAKSCWALIGIQASTGAMTKK